jgi:hypothetical protein
VRQRVRGTHMCGEGGRRAGQEEERSSWFKIAAQQAVSILSAACFTQRTLLCRHRPCSVDTDPAL